MVLLKKTRSLGKTSAYAEIAVDAWDWNAVAGLKT